MIPVDTDADAVRYTKGQSQDEVAIKVASEKEPCKMPVNAAARSIRQNVLFALAIIAFGTQAHAAPITFEIDPSQSVLAIQMNLNFSDYGLYRPFFEQGDLGYGVPGFSNGGSARFGGTLEAEVDLSGSSIAFAGGSIIGESSGSWAPGPGGHASGIAGGYVDTYLNSGFPSIDLPGEAVACLRDLELRYDSASSLTEIGTDLFAFDTFGQFGVTSGTLETHGISGLGLLLDNGSFDWTDAGDGFNFSITNSTLEVIGPNQYRIVLEVNATFRDQLPINLIGQTNVSGLFTGQIVATSVVPEVSPLALCCVAAVVTACAWRRLNPLTGL